jgi:two-component system response regulator FixJ
MNPGRKLDFGTPVYVVDDDAAMRKWLGDALAEGGLTCKTYATGDSFLAELDQLAPGCLLLDMRMPQLSGIEVQTEIVRRRHAMKVIVVTGTSNVETVLEAMKLGALDVLEKPFTTEALLNAVRAALVAIDSEGAR